LKASTILFCAATICAGACFGVARAFPNAPIGHWLVLVYGAAVLLTFVGAVVGGWGLCSAGGWTEKVLGFGCNLVLFLVLVANIVRLVRGYRYGPGP
jgi:hypothetical protein